MKTKLIKLIASIVAIFNLLALGSPVFAECSSNICDCDISDEIKAANGCPGYETKELSSTIQVIINSVIGILGIVAVAFIIIGGVQYITSQGDSTKTKKAKDTILYACIGLVVCALAFAIANFAIGIVNKS